MRYLFASILILTLVSVGNETAQGRGFGGFRGGSFGGSFGGGSFGGSYDRSFGGFGGDRWGSASSSFGASGWGGRSFDSSRTTDAYSGWRGAGASSSYDRSYTTARGGSIDTEGTRAAGVGRYGGAAAGGTRDTSVTTAGGRTYSGDKTSAAAVGPYGRTVGGSERYGTASGPRGTVSGASRTAFAGGRFPSDFGGLAHYSSFGATSVTGHSTAYWSHSSVTTRAGYVRTGFGYYNCFHPAWFTAHPGCWTAAAWTAGAAWRAATWATVASFCSVPEAPIDYDYGNTVVYQDNSVYVNGAPVATADEYSKQATAIADKGQASAAPPTDEWKPLGVFALVQGDEKTSNNLFQLAVDSGGIIRGNYYDGLMDTTSQVYGSVDKKTQRAAWTIGKKNDRVFETGIYNLTQSETPVLIHIGADRTQQWLLVRVEQPKDSK